MSNIKKYTTKSGDVRYKFQVYLGVDPLTGKKKRTNRQGFATLREAKIAKAQLLAGVDEVKSNKSLTFDEVYQEWWSSYKLGLKATSIMSKESIYDGQVKKRVGDYRIDKITKPIIQKFVNEIAQKYKGYGAYYAIVRQVLDYALTEEYIDKLPYQGVVIPRKVVEENKSKPFNYWSDEKVMDFLDIVKDNYSTKWYAVYRLIIYSGMRSREATSLHWDDIDFKNNTISIKRRAIKIKGKFDIDTLKTKDSFRTITMDDETVSILKIWKLEQRFLFRDSKIVFTSKNGEYLSGHSVYTKLMYITDKFNLGKYTVHAFRHNHTSMLVRAGVPIEQISERLGHSNIQTTLNIYNHINKEQKTEAVDLLMKYLGS